MLPLDRLVSAAAPSRPPLVSSRPGGH